MMQRSLFDATTRTLEERFLEFHTANPQVYRRRRREAMTLRGFGHERVSITLLWERLRWMSLTQTASRKDMRKLNNNYKPFYARLLMEREFELEGFFELRKRTVE